MQRLRSMMVKPVEPVEGGAQALAGVLQEGLPSGSHVLVRWRDAVGVPGFSMSDHVPDRLHEIATQLMSVGSTDDEDAQTLSQAWDGEGETRAAIVAHVPETMSQAARRGWLAMAKTLVAIRMIANPTGASTIARTTMPSRQPPGAT